MKSKILVILIVLVSIGTAAWSSMGQSQRGGRVSFEYMVIADPTDNQPEQGLKKLNELGAQGWELAGVRAESTNYAGKLYLKRVKR